MVTDSVNNTATNTVTITQPSALSLTIHSSPTASSGNTGTATVTVSGGTAGYSYLWNPGGQTTSTVSNLGIGTYCVLVTDSMGCTNSACITVAVEPIFCGELFLPDAFSPNSDGENDTLKAYINNITCIKTFSLFIYNRWGEKVFESNDASKGWDGKYNGKPENTAVFVYYLEAEFISGKLIEKKGNVSLIR
jgi:gliding motility-associated-like protein